MNPMIDKLKSIVDTFPEKRVLVLGDVMVDEYIWGNVDRISPEAPVPVVLEKNREKRPGGALNVINNLIALGTSPLIAGVTGRDRGGKYIREYLQANKIDTNGIIEIPEKPTTSKTRIIGNSQQIMRLDTESSEEISDRAITELLEYIDTCSDEISGIIVSDYNKGLINAKILNMVRKLKNEKKIFVAVDPEVRHYKLYSGISLITPNHNEAGACAGIPIDDKTTLDKVAKKIIDEINPDLLLVTLGENGMMLCKSDGSFTRVPTVARHVFDVTGAGDTVIAVFTLAMICGAEPVESAVLSNIAAGYVVGEIGSTVIPFEILKEQILPEYIPL